MTFDHMAVPSNDIPKSVEWYKARFNAKLIYQDESWAFLLIGGQKLAIVSPHQHPPHVAYKVDELQLADASMQTGIKIDTHADGTRGIYLHDPCGNAVELVCYPPGKTVYDREI